MLDKTKSYVYTTSLGKCQDAEFCQTSICRRHLFVFRAQRKLLGLPLCSSGAVSPLLLLSIERKFRRLVLDKAKSYVYTTSLGKCQDAEFYQALTPPVKPWYSFKKSSATFSIATPILLPPSVKPRLMLRTPKYSSIICTFIYS